MKKNYMTIHIERYIRAEISNHLKRTDERVFLLCQDVNIRFSYTFALMKNCI